MHRPIWVNFNLDYSVHDEGFVSSTSIARRAKSRFYLMLKTGTSVKTEVAIGGWSSTQH